MSVSTTKGRDMRILLLFSAIGLTAVAGRADEPAKPITPKAGKDRGTVRERMWVWSHDKSFVWPAHKKEESPAKNRMTAVEGAVYLGVPNVK